MRGAAPPAPPARPTLPAPAPPRSWERLTASCQPQRRRGITGLPTVASVTQVSREEATVYPLSTPIGDRIVARHRTQALGAEFPFCLPAPAALPRPRSGEALGAAVAE